MNEWRYNPKFKGSGILACIPQTGLCPNGCKDCFFQSGRSYLEPLIDNLPHVPSLAMSIGRVVRVNDGHDSNIDRDIVETTVRVRAYADYFFNTAMPIDLELYSGPVVLTINPGFGLFGDMTDRIFHRVENPPKNLMFVRVRVNTWNQNLALEAVIFYTQLKIPIMLTFMAYHCVDAIPISQRPNYVKRIRTTNSYWAITTSAWRRLMDAYRWEHLVYSCGKIEGLNGTTKCVRCGNCLREYYAAKERLRC